MSQINNITAEEAAWLIKAAVNTAREMGKPIDLSEITADSVAIRITQYRNISASYNALVSNAQEVKSGHRDLDDILDGVTVASRRKN